MDNLSTVLKRKRDAEDRQRRSDPLKSIIIGEDGTGGNTSSNPGEALTAAVESLNALIGAVVLAAGTNITLTLNGNTITIDAVGGGAFTDLSDVPAAYTGAGGKAVAVKSDASGLEFVAMPAGGGDMTKAVYDTDDDGVVNQADDALAIDGVAVDLTGVADGYILYYDAATSSIKSKLDDGGGGAWSFSFVALAFAASTADYAIS